MPEDLWGAARALAGALKDKPKLRSFRRAFDLAPEGDDLRLRLSEVTATYSALRTYPMLIGVRLSQLPATQGLLESERDATWLRDAVEVGTAFQIVVEFIRSRLPGYPILRLPHLRDGSPHVFDDPLLVRGFPWDPELRRLGLQLRDPPDMTKLGGDDDCRRQLEDLVAALGLRLAWTRFTSARQALSDGDRRTLSELSKRFAARVEDDAVTEAAGDLLIARFQYRVAELETIVNSAEGAVAEYLSAFEAVDELITVVAALIDTLLTSEALLEAEPYRMDVGQGEDLRPVELAIRGDDPFHSPGAVLRVRGPHPMLSGVVYPTAITHHWDRLDEPEDARMIVSGKLATGPV